MILFAFPTPHSATVVNWSELVACVQNVAETECTIPASTTLFADPSLSFSQDISIVGSGNSVIDLQYASTCPQSLRSHNNFGSLISDPPSIDHTPFFSKKDQFGQVAGLSLTMSNLEVRNGFVSGDGAFVVLTAGAHLSLSSVVLSAFSAGSDAGSTSGGAISGSLSSGVLRDVSFVNCTHALSGAAFFMQDSLGFLFEDVSFTDCNSGDRQSVFYPNSVSYSRSWTSVGSSFSFSGDIHFSNTNKISKATSTLNLALYSKNAPGSNITVTSVVAKPSRFIFQGNPGSMIAMMADDTSFINFEIGELHVSKSSAYAIDSTAIYLESGTTTASNITILGTVNVADIGCLSTVGLVSVEVLGNLTCVTNPTVTNSIYATGNTTMSFGNVLLAGGSNGIALGDAQAPTAPAYMNDTHFIIRSSGDFVMRDGVAWLSLGTFVAIGGQVQVQVAGAFTITNVTSIGAPMFVRWANVSISAHSIDFTSNASPTHAAPALFVDDAILELNSTSHLYFRDNYNPRGMGGAVKLATTAKFSMNSPVIEFAGNTAQYGGAIYIAPHQISAFEKASFRNNVANQGCVVSFSSYSAQCPVFTFADTYNNSITYASSITPTVGCSSQDGICSFSRVPTSSPTRPPARKPSNVWWIALVSVLGSFVLVAAFFTLCCCRMRKDRGGTDCSGDCDIDCC